MWRTIRSRNIWQVEIVFIFLTFYLWKFSIYLSFRASRTIPVYFWLLTVSRDRPYLLQILLKFDHVFTLVDLRLLFWTPVTAILKQGIETLSDTWKLPDLGAVNTAQVFALIETLLLWFGHPFTYNSVAECNFLQLSFRLCKLANCKASDSNDYANSNANASANQCIPQQPQPNSH